jgi:uncharacterized protein involved in exopolysaccharide biosynthesis
MDSIDFAGDSAIKRTPLSEIGAILSRRKWQILVTFLLTVGVVAAVTFTTPKQYDAHMKILVKNERASMVVSTGTSEQASPPGEVSETAINTEIEILKSNDLIQEVVTASGLDRLESGRNGSPSESRQIELENAVNRFQLALKVSPARKTDIIEVVYTAGDPRQAVLALRQLAASYLETHLRVHGTPGTYEFFFGQATQYHRALENAEAALSAFRSKNDIILFGPQKEDILRRASESSSMLLAAEVAASEYERKIADTRLRAAAAEPRVMTQTRTLSNQTFVERLSTMMIELQNRRTQLMSKYRSDDRLVLEVSQEIADTQAALTEAAGAVTASDQATDINPVRQTLELDLAKQQSEYAGLEARREVLRQQANNYREQLNRIGNSTTEYEDLIRTEKEAEDNYLLYARKAEGARIADSLDQQQIANVVIVEHPVEPLRPSKPDMLLNLMAGTLLAALLSLGIAFFAEYLTQPFPIERTDSRIGLKALMDPESDRARIQHAVDLERLTDLPVLAVTKRGNEQHGMKVQTSGPDSTS